MIAKAGFQGHGTGLHIVNSVICRNALKLHPKNQMYSFNYTETETTWRWQSNSSRFIKSCNI